MLLLMMSDLNMIFERCSGFHTVILNSNIMIIPHADQVRCVININTYYNG